MLIILSSSESRLWFASLQETLKGSLQNLNDTELLPDRSGWCLSKDYSFRSCLCTASGLSAAGSMELLVLLALLNLYQKLIFKLCRINISFFI